MRQLGLGKCSERRWSRDLGLLVAIGKGEREHLKNVDSIRQPAFGRSLQIFRSCILYPFQSEFVALHSMAKHHIFGDAIRYASQSSQMVDISVEIRDIL